MSAIKELIIRAGHRNLYIGKQGKRPPGPVVATHDEDRSVLEAIRDELGVGYVCPKSRRETGGSWSWTVYDEDAAMVITLLIPGLKEGHGREIKKRLAWAGNVLCDWRRRKLYEDNRHCHLQTRRLSSMGTRSGLQRP